MVIPVGTKFVGYAREVAQALHKARLHVEVDDSGETLNKKIRTAELGQWNFTLVVGDSEERERSVNVRNRDDAGQKTRSDVTVPLETLVQKLSALKSERRMDNKLA